MPVQTDFGTHPASHTMVLGLFRPGGKEVEAWCENASVVMNVLLACWKKEWGKKQTVTHRHRLANNNWVGRLSRPRILGTLICQRVNLKREKEGEDYFEPILNIQ